MDDRQRDALGVAHDHLRSLSVAVVGCGGTGSPLAEQLARMGVRRCILIDPDRLDTASNVRRVFGSTAKHLQAKERPAKVDVVGAHLEHLDLDVAVERVVGDVRREEVFRRLLDVDVVMCATDSHSSRAILNELPSVYLTPVIDVGVRVGTTVRQGLSGLLAEIRTLTPTTPCLWCRRAIDADVVRFENLLKDERERLEREGYVPGAIGAPAPSVVGLTVLGSALASCALLSMLSEEGAVVPSAYWVDGFMGDSALVQPVLPVETCRCRSRIGLGDTAPPGFLIDV